MPATSQPSGAPTRRPAHDSRARRRHPPATRARSRHPAAGFPRRTPPIWTWRYQGV
jgi:hypothetical protein